VFLAVWCPWTVMYAMRGPHHNPPGGRFWTLLSRFAGRMTVRRFLLVAAPSVLAAAGCLILASVLDQDWLYVAGVGFVAVAVASKEALLDDWIMAGIVIVAFVGLIVIGLVNA
jgi:hypothetical protein